MNNIKEKISFNLLNIIEGADYNKLKKIYDKYKNWTKALKYLNISDQKYNPQKEYQKIEEDNIKLILREEKDYPPQLKEIPLAPFGLYVLGDYKILKQKIIAVVGTRKSSQEGKNIACKFSKTLSQAGLIIASGLALGIDSTAHQTIIEEKNKTIAVLGSGLKNIYPQTNLGLAQKIIKYGGAIVSEYNIYAPPLPYRFLERNRIISGLSLGVVIIEAPVGSGALNTARYAIDQNRELWVVPGSIYNPNFYGSNNLIKNGAALVTEPEDILKDLNIEIPKDHPHLLNLSSQEKLIYETIKNYGVPINIDKIIEITNLKSQIVIQTVSLLILKNIIQETEIGYIITKWH